MYVRTYVHVRTFKLCIICSPPSSPPHRTPSLQLPLNQTTTQRLTPSANMPVCHQGRHLTLAPAAKTPQQLKRRFVRMYVYVCTHIWSWWKLCTHSCKHTYSTYVVHQHVCYCAKSPVLYQYISAIYHIRMYMYVLMYCWYSTCTYNLVFCTLAHTYVHIGTVCIQVYMQSILVSLCILQFHSTRNYALCAIQYLICVHVHAV